MAPESNPDGVLWSAATAREIVTLIAQDVETGQLDPDEAIDLIDRVRARAGPAHHSTAGTQQPAVKHHTYLPVPKSE